jgi:hypothetical protein
VLAAQVVPEPATASVTKVMPVEPEPPEFSD